MIKMEYGTFVNEYGFMEKYVKKELTSFLTGHLHLGSAFETFDSCGNCNGARCNACYRKYEISKYDIPVDDPVQGGYVQKRLNHKITINEEEALKYYESF